MITIDYTYYKIQTDVLNEAINYFSILNEEDIFLFLKIKLLHILYIFDTSFRIIDLLFFDIQKFPSNNLSLHCHRICALIGTQRYNRNKISSVTLNGEPLRG